MDHDFDLFDLNPLSELTAQDVHNHPFVLSESMVGHLSASDCLTKLDPLAHVHHVSIEPLKLTYVDPHWVNGYLKADGTYVQGYFRDGDGDTSTFDGDGYYRRS